MPISEIYNESNIQHLKLKLMEIRRIKIRAWDDLNKEMLYPNHDIFSGRKNAGQLLNQEEIIMLYSGINDKNGKEIYESDIYLEWGKPVLAEWINSDSSQGFFICTDDWDLEVIGNIYENPEIKYDVYANI